MYVVVPVYTDQLNCVLILYNTHIQHINNVNKCIKWIHQSSSDRGLWKSQSTTVMLEAPVTPKDENETTSVVIPEGASMQEIEQVAEDVLGRINIIDNVMYRDMPDCTTKAGLSTTWGHLFGKFLYKNNIFSVGGTGGTMYLSKNLLSPDLSAWNLNEVIRHQDPGVAEHLMRFGAAPNWVLEFKWEGELNKPHKGIRKVLDHFFNEVGTNQSRVEEAWVLVKRQDVPVHNMPPPPSFLLRTVRGWSYVPYIGVFFFVFLLLLDILTGTQGWTGRSRRRTTPPADPAVPYIIMYFRQHAEQRYGYYWLHWHEDFHAPAPSLYYGAPPVSVNPLLKMMCEDDKKLVLNGG